MQITERLHGFIWRNPGENNCNTYYLEGEQRIIVDPGHRHLFAYVESGLAQTGLTAEMIDVVIATHGHPDHMEGALRFPPATLFGMGGGEYRAIKEIAGAYMNIPKPAFLLKEGTLILGDITLHVIETPGHSPGSLCFYWPREKALFCGDVLFKDGIGRTDLPGGSGALLKKSIETLSTLDVEVLLPGHGDIIRGKEAVRENFRNIEKNWFAVLR